jgi:hypothetical protein
MSMEDRELLETEIETVLLEQWDPLGKGGESPRFTGYREYAHEIFNLLARGASDVQITRRLHMAEATELNHPELVERDISTVVRALRKIESKI